MKAEQKRIVARVEELLQWCDTLAASLQPGRMPFVLKPEQYDGSFGDLWREILNQPDHAPLEKFQQQPELF